jgi:hypothetical protein
VRNGGDNIYILCINDYCTINKINNNMKDSIVESVRQDLLDRSEVGIKKYNSTLDREDLSAGDWLVHAYQEMLDGALYLKRLHKEWDKTHIYVLASDFRELEISNNLLDDVNADLNAKLHIKNKIIENLTKVIKSQEEEIKELQKDQHLKNKIRAWHY